MSTSRAEIAEAQHLELPLEEFMRRVRPLPPHDKMAIEDLTEDESAAFLRTVGR
ncbi:MAG: hypothetical protein ABSH36_01000 [Solirubrobacteraceae bacterium]